MESSFLIFDSNYTAPLRRKKPPDLMANRDVVNVVDAQQQVQQQVCSYLRGVTNDLGVHWSDEEL